MMDQFRLLYKHFARIAVDSSPQQSRWHPIFFHRKARRFLRRKLRLYYSPSQIECDIILWFLDSPDVVGKMVDMSSAFEYGMRVTLLGRLIRNEYGLWETENPYTKSEDFAMLKGIIVDPKHPDNVSGEIVEKVMLSLRQRWEAQQESKDHINEVSNALARN